MCIDSKVQISKSCIRQVLTYGIETRDGPNKSKRLIRAEMKTLRTIAWKTLRDKLKRATQEPQSRGQNEMEYEK